MPAKSPRKRPSKPLKGRSSFELEPSRLRWVCRRKDIGSPAGARDEAVVGIIGQERAIRALRMGIELYGPGMNVFVTGITGTGRTATVERILGKIKGACPLPPDRCYVYNFQKEDEPKLLTLPRGFGARFRLEMERFVRWMQSEVRAWLDSESHSKMREKVTGRFEGEADRIIERFERQAEKSGFALKRVRDGSVIRPELFPIIAGQATPIGDIEKMVSEGKMPRRKADDVARQYEGLRLTLEATARQSRDLLGRMESEVSDMERKEIRHALEERASSIVQKYPDEASPALTSYLKDVVEEILSSLELFSRQAADSPPGRDSAGEESESPAGPAGNADHGVAGQVLLRRLLDKLKVNVIFDSRRHGACPVIVETHPSYRRLFGYFEKSLDPSGHWTTDYTRVRPGSLMAADGGYLILTAEDLFSQREVWVELKRTLISRTLSINEEAGAWYPAVSLKPEPIPNNAKVILIGQRGVYDYLLDAEPDFRKVFKVIADFDEEMVLNPKTLREYAAFAHKVSADEGLAAMDPTAVAAMAEQGVRMAGRQGKLSTRFGEIADILRESDYWRRVEGKSRKVAGRHVRTAVREARRRQSLSEDKMKEMVRDGVIFIDVAGMRTGQVNGLVVHQTGNHTFGLPTRITATVSPGTSGIVSIEREARLSGPTHTKGILIIGGFLREKFGQNKPVTLSSSITFEQSYADIEGDSASSTEIYALLSALSGLPLRQEIAVTGSVDQKGDIQPVGGINDKIEGFFRICQIKGLTGTQGILMPESNIEDLMLDEEVVASVRSRRFHIYPVRSVEEGVEVLMGIPAGERMSSGRYPDRTVFRRVDERLDHFNEMVRRYGPTGGF